MIALCSLVRCRSSNNTPSDTSDDAWLEHERITATDAAREDFFGEAVSMDADDIAVAAPLDDTVEPQNIICNSGSVRVFERMDNGTTTDLVDDIWNETQVISARDGACGDAFASSVSVVGEIVVAGSFGDDDLGSASGSAYLFRSLGDAWFQVAKLLPLDGKPNDHFGESVDLGSGTAVVARHFWDVGGNESGAAYIFDVPTCETPIPATSSWTLFVLAILTAAAGNILIARRRQQGLSVSVSRPEPRKKIKAPNVINPT